MIRALRAPLLFASVLLTGCGTEKAGSGTARRPAVDGDGAPDNSVPTPGL
ncbi:hypothetical protein [Streptomyces sp. NPDC091215]